MAVTELALLRLRDLTTATSPSLLAHLKQAKDAMQKFSGFSFYFLHCLEDPSLIFILGGWPSVKFHMEEWIPSKENQELLALMGEVEVEYMFHIDLEPEEREGVVMCGSVSVGRYFVKKGQKEALEKTFREGRGVLEGHFGGKEKVKVKGGWRIDRGYVKGDEQGREKKGEEWVLFMGWESKERQLAFTQTEEFEVIEGADVKHGLLLEV